MTPNYAHVPLNRSRDAFRLIELQPAQDPQAPIKCRLRHASIDDGLAYEALSYTWNKGPEPTSIFLDDIPFPVTQNLHAALRALRWATEKRQLWVDAICINQNDIAERNYEVLRMREIYKRAERVIIWLGEAGPDSELAVDHIALLSERFEYLVSKRLLCRVLRTLTSLAEFLINFVKFLFLMLIRNFIVLRFLARLLLNSIEEPKWRLGTPFWVLGKTLAWSAYLCVRVWINIKEEHERKREPDAQTVEALKDIFTRPWFGRVWVVQEIAMAREAVLVLGPHSIPWKQLSNAYQWLYAAVSLSACGTIYFRTRFQRLNELMWTLTRRRKGRRSSFAPGIRLLDLLCRMCYLQTTDDHDRVYGLFGLCDDIRHLRVRGESFKPDYDESVEDTYMRLAKFVIEATGRLDILHCCSNVRRNPALPSWVPDWRDSTPRNGQQIQNEAFYLQAEPAIPVADFDDEEREIRVRGFVIGELTNEKLQMYTSRHGAAENHFLTLVFMASSYSLVPVWSFLMECGLVVWVIRLLRRRASGPCKGMLESLEMTCSRIPEDVEEEYPITPVNLAETANSFDREEVAYTMFGCAFEPWLADRFEAGDDVFWSAECNTYTAAARPGDLICMLHGNPLPTLLRWEDGGVFTVVGVASLVNMDNMLPKWCQREYSERGLPLIDFTLR